MGYLVTQRPIYTPLYLIVRVCIVCRVSYSVHISNTVDILAIHARIDLRLASLALCDERGTYM